MKIAILGTRYSPPHFRGGEEHIIHYLNTYFQARGCEVDVYTPKFKKWESIDADSTADNVIRVPVSNIRFFYHYQFAARLPKYLRSHQYDVVVNTHSPLGMELNIGPHVLVINTTCIGEADAVRGFSPRKIVERIMRRTFSLAVEKQVANQCQHIICANHHILDEVTTHLHVKPHKLSMIGNGVDCDHFIPAASPPASIPDPFNVLYVGRLVDRKNVKLLIQTAHRIKEFYSPKAAPFNIRIVGYGEDRAALEQLATELGVTDLVTFLGRKAGQDLLDLYQSSHVYVLPSRYEGMPLALLEALSCGLPSIVGNFSGASAIISDGFNGYVLTDDSPETCAQRLISMTRDYSGYRVMCRHAREVILEKFSWDCIIDQYFDVFEAVTNPQSQVLK